ncbi:MAG: alpha/beta hydrolase [Alphaproteobacteria bacterium]|nr:alpha/beta hydrolase [Alphaproteobacteria bacterium]
MEIQVDGKTVFAATGGKPVAGEKPLLILVHGAGMDRTVWSGQTRWLAHHGVEVMAVDLPGHGRSEGPALESIEAMADWLLTLIAATGRDKVRLAGHSMGGLVVLEATARAPDKVERLSFFGSALAIPVAPPLITGALAGQTAVYAKMIEFGVGLTSHRGGNPAPGLWTSGAGLKLMAAYDPAVLALDLAACDAYKNGETAASKVACPAQVVIGAEDRMTAPRNGAALGAAIAGAETVTLEKLGHMMMMENPGRITDAAGPFMVG